MENDKGKTAEILTEIVTEETISKYMEFLGNEEIFGILNGRFSCMGVCDRKSGQPLGILTAEIHMSHIRVRRVRVLPEAEGTARALMDIVTDLPEDMALPVLFFGTDEDVDEKLLTESGFTETDCRYSCIEGSLTDFKAIEAPPKCDIGTLDQVPFPKVESFVLGSEHDRILLTPDGYLERDRFSDASLCCMDSGKVTGVILLEEKDDFIQIPYIRTKDGKALLFAFYVLRKLLTAEFAPDTKIRFLLCDGVGREAVNAIFPGGREKKIRGFRYE